jgi:hypothetical protein
MSVPMCLEHLDSGRGQKTVRLSMAGMFCGQKKLLHSAGMFSVKKSQIPYVRNLLR